MNVKLFWIGVGTLIFGVVFFLFYVKTRKGLRWKGIAKFRAIGVLFICLFGGLLNIARGLPNCHFFHNPITNSVHRFLDKVL
jgi:hypothetical protein